MERAASPALHREVLSQCQASLPGWRGLDVEDFGFDAPKGFSSFTMGVRARPERAMEVEPPAVLYRRLAGKENAILDSDTEREVYLLLSDEGLAARCLHYDTDHRLEQFYVGRTLRAEDLLEPSVLEGIAAQLWRFHQVQPQGLPERTFFELLGERWGPLAHRTLVERRDELPAGERPLCDDLLELLSESTREKVMACLPDEAPVFCHNDTYHGNVFRLSGGEIRLLDFEFSCLGHRAFDLANLVAETKMRHGLSEPPHFAVAEPIAGPREIDLLAQAYVAHDPALETMSGRNEAAGKLAHQVRSMVLLSDYMYALAALPLALEPIQKIRFLPYAHLRFRAFLEGFERIPRLKPPR